MSPNVDDANVIALAWRILLGELALHDLSSEQSSALTLQASGALDWLFDRMRGEAPDAGVPAGGLQTPSCEQRRAEIVHRLLAGARIGGAELVELGYELEAWHLAVIATGEGAEKVVRRLASGFGRQLLLVAHGADAVYAWLGGQRQLAAAEVQRALSRYEPVSVALSIGGPAAGLEGWRLSYEQAQAALLVAQHRPSRLTTYFDVALEAAALRDKALGDALIDTYLAPLDDEQGGGLIRRRVLRALFDAEYNKSSAAQMLGMDRDTIHRQVKEIERRLGFRLPERQAELELGLRLESLRAGAAPSRL